MLHKGARGCDKQGPAVHQGAAQQHTRGSGRTTLSAYTVSSDTSTMNINSRNSSARTKEISSWDTGRQSASQLFNLPAHSWEGEGKGANKAHSHPYLVQCHSLWAPLPNTPCSSWLRVKHSSDGALQAGTCCICGQLLDTR